jgi:hypothetical protein
MELGADRPIDKIYAARDFGFCSFAFAVISGFCIGGTALTNIIGIVYVNKRLSLTYSVSLYRISPFSS